MNYIQVTIHETNQDKKEGWIALLNNMEIRGLEETEKGIIVYWDEDKFPEERFKELIDNNSVAAEKEILPERNWNEEWERNFAPVLIADFCSVRADFHPKPENVLYDIVITPKMSFGTGHHATTAGMITMMKSLTFRDKHVLDFGTGTGILAILSDMMGAASVLAIDNDEWSYNNAIENCNANDTNHVTVQQTTVDNLEGHLEFDIILANINRHVLLEYMAPISIFTKNKGTLLLSGILEQDIPIIRTSAEQNDFTYQEEIINNNWVCMRFTKR